MNSHDNSGLDRDVESDVGAGDDVTLAAGSDVVAQIRAHAAKVRSGEVTEDDGVQIWTPEPDAEPVAAPAVTPAAPVAIEPARILPNDETVPLASTKAELAQAITEAKAEPPPAATTPPTQPVSGSLIAGQTPPEVSTSFWTTDQPFRASGIDGPARMQGASRIPLGAWIALAIVVIVVASVGIAVAIASTGPVL